MRDVFVVELRRPYEFKSPVVGHEYVAWILSNDQTLTEIERDKLAASLVATGCRYAVCSGIKCSEWDHAIDIAYLETSPDFNPPEEKFVMTSWHENEPLADIAEFLVRHTSFDDFTPSTFVIVSVGSSKDTVEATVLVKRLVRTLST